MLLDLRQDLPDRWAVRANFVLPGAGPPEVDSVVTIRGDRIESIEAASDAPTIDLGDAVLLPGLINAHTHLEFSELPGPLGNAGMSLADWVPLVVAYRRKLLADHGDQIAVVRARAVAAGLAECLRSGCTTVGEIATLGWPDEPFRQSPLTAILFQELIDLSREFSGMHQGLLREHLEAENPSWIPGVSPHAPYSVHPQSIAELATLSRRRRAPLAMHVAESRDELQLLRSGDGPLQGMLESLGAWRAEPFSRSRRPLDVLSALAEAERALIVHGNYLDETEWEFVAARRARMAVVYCPRTHAYFNHAPYPLAAALRRGARICLGTDSRASNPDLDLLAELRFAAERHPELSPAGLLGLLTTEPAAALGLSDRGRIAPGCRADLIALSADSVSDPYEALLASGKVRQVILGGRPVPAFSTDA